MPNGECIFCQIVNKRIPAKIVYQDKDSVAFLDVNPRSRGMTIVVPRKHINSFDQDRELASKIFDKALIVAEKIKKSLRPVTIFFSVMQAKVPHFHVRVYPVYKDQVPLVENKPIEATGEELDKVAGRIRSAVVSWRGREEIERVVEKPKKKKPKKKRSKEDVEWIKRDMEIA